MTGDYGSSKLPSSSPLLLSRSPLIISLQPLTTPLKPMGSPSVLSSLARRLEGKVALIAGGASGIGEATVRLFARHGAQVIVADIQDDRGRSLCDQVGASAASYVHCDIANESHVHAAVDAAVSRHGKLDIMVNNAGISGDFPPRPLIESDKADFERVVATNLVGCYLGTKHAARVMVAARRGSIVATASAATVLGTAPAAYTASKHGVVGLMQSAAVELGRYGVRANCVSPYLVATPLTVQSLGVEGEEIEKWAEEIGNLKGVRLKADDVAEALMYLGSDESKYVSGINLIVDGGFTITKPLT